MPILPIKLLLFFVLLLFIGIFSFQNTSTITVSFFYTFELPLIGIIFGSMIVGSLLTIPFYLRQYYLAKNRMKKKVKEVKQEEKQKK